MNLYEKIHVSNYKKLLDEDDKSFMAYCPECESEVTFQRSGYYNKVKQYIEFNRHQYIPGSGQTEDLESTISYMFNSGGKKDQVGGLYIQEYECCVNRNHRKYNIYHKYDDKIIKIGQYPSEADNGSNEYLDKVKAICDKKEAKEISKYIKIALIMESYGYGIASLLYMRRAFEILIATSEGKDRNDNTGVTMRDRIKNNQYLPKVIKENARVYNVISEGIHNQTEEECIELFKVIKAGVIILISKTYAHVEEERTLAALGVTLSKL